jgi:hypothetical protein
MSHQQLNAIRYVGHLREKTFTHSDLLRETEHERLSNEAVSGQPPFQDRVLLNLSEALISCGLWLKARIQTVQAS